MNNCHSILTGLSPSKASRKFARLPRTMVGSKADLLPALLPAAKLTGDQPVGCVEKGIEGLFSFCKAPQ
jgi:hypothetical protein